MSKKLVVNYGGFFRFKRTHKLNEMKFEVKAQMFRFLQEKSFENFELLIAANSRKKVFFDTSTPDK